MQKRKLLARALDMTGLGQILSLSLSRWEGVVIFNYHRVGDPNNSQFDRALWSATADEFSQQVSFLKSSFDIITGEDLRDVLNGRPGRAMMITFDDGYRDNYEIAFPILKDQGVPATFFVTSGFIDDRKVAWWDEIAWMVRTSPLDQLPGTIYWSEMSLRDNTEVAINSLLGLFKSLPHSENQAFLELLAHTTGSGRCPADIASEIWMTWDMIREMDRNGMEIGGHTVTHPVLACADRDVQCEEIFLSKRRIEAEIEHPIISFSYPVGQPDSFDETTKQLLHAAGYEWGFSFFGGFQLPHMGDPYDIPRIPVSPHLSLELFQQTAHLPQLFA